MPPQPPRIRFHYIKSNAHRVVHVDGVIGGPTPNGHIHASFFSERIPIPTMIEHETMEHGPGVFKLGAESAKESKAGFVREVEVGIVLTTTMAKKLHGWLAKNLKAMGETTEEDEEVEVGDAQ